MAVIKISLKTKRKELRNIHEAIRNMEELSSDKSAYAGFLRLQSGFQDDSQEINLKPRWPIEEV